MLSDTVSEKESEFMFNNVSLCAGWFPAPDSIYQLPQLVDIFNVAEHKRVAPPLGERSLVLRRLERPMSLLLGSHPDTLLWFLREPSYSVSDSGIRTNDHDDVMNDYEYYIALKKPQVELP
ncbi:hypothetical protein NDU88_007088 [Pleurodeles waltl]|uniref:Uncharacterized protein n=1 Tax=Pleurodeles waltl TaxID=8319 RepID=A0AAV7N600_PLEWA|nr:hypothetical protein NDU88_007088 [Pleurodeles waltl]